MRTSLELYFEFARLETNWRTEILAAFTTFVTNSLYGLRGARLGTQTGFPTNEGA